MIRRTETEILLLIIGGNDVYLTEEGRQRILAEFPDEAVEEGGLAVNV